MNQIIKTILDKNKNIGLLTLYCFVLFFGLFFYLPAHATSFYVDFNSGADANNGLSTSTAFKHHPDDPNATGMAASTTFSPGDIVYFKKGVTYDGQITLKKSGSLLLTGSQGRITTAGVLTDSTAAIQSSGVQPGDYIYIYNNSTTGSYINTCGLWPVASVDSQTQLTIYRFDGLAHSTAELTYKIFRPITLTSKDDWGTGVATLRQGNTYIIRPMSTSYIRISDLTFTHTSIANENSCAGTNSASILDNNITNGWVVENCVFNHVQGAVSGAGDYSIIRRNTITDWGGLAVASGKYALVEGNTLRSGMSALRGFGKYSIIRHNTIIDANRSSVDYCGFHADAIGPLFSPSADPGSNQYGWIYGNYIANSLQGIFLEYNNGGTSYWTIHSNVLIGYAGAGGVGDSAILVSVAPNTKIYNNTIFGINGGHGWGNAIKIDQRTGYGASPNCTIKNNIFYSVSLNAPAINIATAANGVGLVCSGNIYYVPNKAKPFGYNGVLKTWTDWSSTLGFDSDTGAKFGIDPRFVNTVGTDLKNIDLSLSQSSPLLISKDTAITPFISQDVRKMYRSADISWTKGAYEPSSPPTKLRMVP